MQGTVLTHLPAQLHTSLLALLSLPRGWAELRPPHAQLCFLGALGLSATRCGSRAAQLAGEGTQITHQPAGRQNGREAGSGEDLGCWEASLTLRASAGGDVAEQVGEEGFPEAPPAAPPG